MGAAQVTRSLAMKRASACITNRAWKHNITRQFGLLAIHFRNNTTKVGLNAICVKIMARHHPALPVFVGRTGAMMQASNQSNFVHHLGHHRKVFADLYAVYIRLNGFKFTSYFSRRIGFHIPSIELTRRTNQKNRDTVANLRICILHRTQGFQLEQRRQRQRCHACCSQLQETAP